jgi:hypothetical protein
MALMPLYRYVLREMRQFRVILHSTTPYHNALSLSKTVKKNSMV